MTPGGDPRIALPAPLLDDDAGDVAPLGRPSPTPSEPATRASAPTAGHRRSRRRGDRDVRPAAVLGRGAAALALLAAIACVIAVVISAARDAPASRPPLSAAPAQPDRESTVSAALPDDEQRAARQADLAKLRRKRAARTGLARARSVGRRVARRRAALRRARALRRRAAAPTPARRGAAPRPTGPPRTVQPRRTDPSRPVAPRRRAAPARPSCVEFPPC